MRRMKNGTVMMELNQDSKLKGYTMRANISPNLIRMLKRWNQDSAAIIRAAIKRGDCKKVISEMQNAKNRNRKIRELSEHHNKLVRDASGKIIFLWDYQEKKMYGILDD